MRKRTHSPTLWLRAWRKLSNTVGQWRRGEVASPSSSRFGALVTDRKRWLFDTLPLASAEYHYDIFTKESQQRIARRLGLPVAESYATMVSLDEALEVVDRLRLERFVLKPNESSSSIGFRPLVREGASFRDVRNGRVSSSARLKRGLIREWGRLERPDEWIVEELLLPVDGSLRPLDDYKLYCLGGRVELIYHAWKLKRRPWKARNWYTRDWMPVTPSIKGPNDGPAYAPLRGLQFVEMAEAVSSRLCYPFIRVDLYDTTRGVVLGELTPGPGGRHNFVPEWDERLSRRWHEVAAELSEGIRTGRIEPLSAELETDTRSAQAFGGSEPRRRPDAEVGHDA